MPGKFTQNPEMGRIVERQMSQWELSRTTAEKPDRPPGLSGGTEIDFIAISRQLGSGGAEIASTLSELMDWQVYDREILNYMSENMDVHVKAIESIDEKTISWINDWLAPLFSAKTDDHVEMMSYYKHLGKVLLVIAKHGRAIIVGRAAGMILPRDKGLSVRVVAPFEQRLERITTREKISPQEATQRIRQSDKQQARFVKEFLQKDIDDPKHYDIVINTEKLHLTYVAKLIWRALDQRMVSRQEQVKVSAEGEDIARIVERQMQQWEKQRDQKELPRNLPHLVGGVEIDYITIGRQLGAGGAEVSQILADLMEWQRYDREILDYMAKNMKVHVRLLTSLDERTVGWIGNRLMPFLKRKTRTEHVKQMRYFQHLGEVLLALAKHGRAIILGRGAGLILPREKGLNVFVVAPFELRCKRYAREKDLRLEEATAVIKKADKNLTRFTRKFFNKKVADPMDYDIICNTEKIYPTSAAKFIWRTLDQRRITEQKPSSDDPASS